MCAARASIVPPGADRPAPPGSSPQAAAARLILASTSPYRRQLLARLELPFQVLDPGVDERREPGESGAQSVERLARAKAAAAARQLAAAAGPEPAVSLIIGSDQLSQLDGVILGKPGTHEAARKQLYRASGREVEFVTAIALFNSATAALSSRVIRNQVQFRNLSESQVEAYLRLEQPYDCAGGFKSEGLGIALFQRISGDDPNALIGLPLIALCELLAAQGLDVLTAAGHGHPGP